MVHSLRAPGWCIELVYQLARTCTSRAHRASCLAARRRRNCSISCRRCTTEIGLSLFVRTKARPRPSSSAGRLCILVVAPTPASGSGQASRQGQDCTPRVEFCAGQRSVLVRIDFLETLADGWQRVRLCALNWPSLLLSALSKAAAAGKGRRRHCWAPPTIPSLTVQCSCSRGQIGGATRWREFVLMKLLHPPKRVQRRASRCGCRTSSCVVAVLS